MMRLLYFFLPILGFTCKNAAIERAFIRPEVLVTEKQKWQQSDTLVNGVRVGFKDMSACFSGIPNERPFFQDRIGLFGYRDVMVGDASKESFYTDMLIRTGFVKFEMSDFLPQNYVFSLKKYEFKGYGKCSVASWYFPLAAGVNQSRTFIIWNQQRKEFSIWDFDTLTFKNDMVFAKFEVRGKRSQYTMKYFDKCQFFTPKE